MESDSLVISSSSSSDFFSPVNEARERLRYHLIDTIIQNGTTSAMSLHERFEFIDYLHYNSPFSSFNFDQTLAHNPHYLMALQYSSSVPQPQPQPHAYFTPLYYPMMQQQYVVHPSPLPNYSMMFVAHDQSSSDYEDLLELQERIGRVNVGLSEETISKNLKTSYIDHVVKEDEDEVCVVCQEGYRDKEMIGSLDRCGHRYHANCIKNWLLQKNVCPICKATALVL